MELRDSSPNPLYYSGGNRGLRLFTCPWSHNWQNLESSAHLPSGPLCLLCHHVPRAGRPCKNRDENRCHWSQGCWVQDEGMTERSRRVTSTSTCFPPPQGHCAHWQPLQMMAFSANGREVGLSLSLPQPPIVISCHKILDGRGNTQVLMR